MTARLGPLGHATGYPDRYDPSLLFAVARAPQRQEIGLGDALPFTGADVWTAYEHTWLGPRGKPRIAMLSLEVPAHSPYIVESKSVKLYLGSYAQSSFVDEATMLQAVAADLTAAAGAAVKVSILQGDRFAPLPGHSIDEADVAVERYHVDPALLAVGEGTAEETLHTDLFRSVCPVTGQPDYASIAIAYRGPRIDRGALLRYLVSYRLHAGFHEHCAERIFVDVARRCGCEALTVHARFTRRGGLDINPFRTNAGEPVPPNVRVPRQ